MAKKMLLIGAAMIAVFALSRCATYGGGEYYYPYGYEYYGPDDFDHGDFHHGRGDHEHHGDMDRDDRGSHGGRG